ncbi:hypothetical protein A15D_01382 [Alcanivorax sp. MD8A]|uniref:DUF6488 family protein n=1 Tax=Alcanivorax sp. MD8A TaxID=1177157 RepID=UPI000C9C5FC6|nr:DUF6488 family protein [Alcanivorax sp. MD8A]PNE02979.1 hypothetical protein A15D_01382 [Alcanivorax sp. MD8A]
MKLIKALMIVAVLAVSGRAFSHGGDHDPISEQQAVGIAKYVAVKLTEEDRGMGFGVLDESWKDLPEEKVGISKSGPGYYIVAMEHEEEGRTLYILMSETGSVYDANFTGQFKGIE